MATQYQQAVKSNAQGMVIPKGKTLILMKGNTEIPANVPCVLEEDITLSLSSTFAPLISGGMPNIAKLLAGVIGGIFDKNIPVGFKQFGYQIWQNTDPVSFSATVAFYMSYNARVEVYNPTIELMKLPLPTEIGKRGGLKAPGPTIFSLIKKEGLARKESKPGSEESEEKFDEDAEGTRTLWDIESGDQLSLSIGKILYLPNVIVKKAEPTFSTETDEFDYPIWSKVRLDISSVEIATTDMIGRRV